jgi:hypothetical protein
MNEIKIVRARAAAMSSIGVLINHDRESLLQIISWVEDHLLEEKVKEENALLDAIAAIRKAQYGKA